jgi:transposase InsO family protein
MTLVDRLRDRFGVEPILRVLDIPVSTFYGWVARRRRPSPRDIEQVWLGEQVQRIRKESDGTYGSPKVHAQLRREGIRTSRKRVERLMREAGLQGAFMRKRRRSSTRCDPRRHPSTGPGQPQLQDRRPRPAVGRRYLAHPDRGGPAVAGQHAGWVLAADRAGQGVVAGVVGAFILIA